MHLLAPVLMRRADDGAGCYGRVGGNHAFHFNAVDVFAAGDDHVLDTVYDEYIAVFIHAPTVTGVHPAVADGSRSLCRLVPITEHDARATYDDFTHFAARQLIAFGVNNAYFGADRSAACAAMPTLGAAFLSVHFGFEDGGHGG